MMEKYFDLPGDYFTVRCKLYYDPAGFRSDSGRSSAAVYSEASEKAAADHAAPADMRFRHVILFCHGFAGHKDNAAAQKLAEKILAEHADTALLIFNWPGHGDDEHDSISLADCSAYLRTVLWYINGNLRPEILDVCATSFGGYLVLKYISDAQESPFRRICLRCPAVVMDEVLTKTILTPSELQTIAAGGSVPAGFDRKVLITGEFLDSLRETGLFNRDLRSFADRIVIVQGTADEVVPCDAVRTFAERNGLRLLLVDGADHRFLDPAKMEIVLNTFMDHLGL